MNTAVVIGFGRFGQLLADLLAPTFQVQVVEQEPEKVNLALEKGYQVISLENVSGSEYIFLAVPISKLPTILRELANHVTPEHVVIDVCSVKVYPIKLMKKYLKSTQLIGTHPLFGPDSAQQGIAGLQVALCPISASHTNTKVIEDFWAAQGANVIITTPEKHDHDVIYSLAFTHSLARIIQDMHPPNIQFTTRSYQALKQIADLSVNDSEQLFKDMMLYNPYLSTMSKQFELSLKKLDQLLHELANSPAHKETLELENQG